MSYFTAVQTIAGTCFTTFVTDFSNEKVGHPMPLLQELKVATKNKSAKTGIKFLILLLIIMLIFSLRKEVS